MSDGHELALFACVIGLQCLTRVGQYYCNKYIIRAPFDESMPHGADRSKVKTCRVCFRGNGVLGLIAKWAGSVGGGKVPPETSVTLTHLISVSVTDLGRSLQRYTAAIVGLHSIASTLSTPCKRSAWRPSPTACLLPQTAHQCKQTATRGITFRCGRQGKLAGLASCHSQLR